MSETEMAVSEAEIRELLLARRGDWLSIAKNAGVSHSWLSKFVNGHIGNPGIATLRKVRDAVLPASQKA